MEKQPRRIPVSERDPYTAYRKSETIVTALVQRENERLTRLLRNLYQEFRLSQGDRTQLGEHICRELAQYFHCDCCQLYLVRQENVVSDSGVSAPQEALVLVAAFGPWERALHPRYVRRIFRTQYDLNGDSHTARVLREADARVDMSRRSFRKRKQVSSHRPVQRQVEDAEWHLVWWRDNLYSVSRNILSCPVLRHRSRQPKPQGHAVQAQPYPIGLIKLENRRPPISHAFEFDQSAGDLYLGAYFELCAVAGYLNDLRKRADIADSVTSLFMPLHDADGWRQHFQERPTGCAYFQEILAWQQDAQESMCNKEHSIIQKQLHRQYADANRTLSEVLDCVVEVEVFLQELTMALGVLGLKTGCDETLWREVERLPENAPAPSLFNAIGLVKAKEKVGWLRNAFRDAILEFCPAAENTDDPKSVCQHLLGSTIGELTRDDQITEKEATVLQRLVDVFTRRNRQWSGLLEARNRNQACDWLCRFLESIAQRVRAHWEPAGRSIPTPAAMAAYQSAHKVMHLRKQAKSGQESDSQDFDAIEHLGELSAVACMRAHTFDSWLDTARLFSVQSHVGQVLDNYLLDRARMAGTGVTFDHIETLGLTDSSMDELERLAKLLADTGQCFESLIRREAEHEIGPQMQTNLRDVGDILEDLVSLSLRESTGPIDLLDVQMRSSPAETLHSLMSNGILTKWKCKDLKDSLVKIRIDKDSIKLQLLLSSATMRGPIVQGPGIPHDRPSPLWLFRLNTELEDLCGHLRSLPDESGAGEMGWKRGAKRICSRSKRPDTPRIASAFSLRDVIEQLFGAVQQNARQQDEEKFFTAIRNNLNRTCAVIARQVNAQSCGIFFATNDPSPEWDQKLVMRGADGRLLKTLADGGQGCIYDSLIKKDGSLRCFKPALTHVVWHGGLGRWANMRREMEHLRSISGGGKGDKVAYPGENTLDLIFRNCVIVPIFSLGRVSRPIRATELRKLIELLEGIPLGPEEEAKHLRFLQQYRVVGILKVENKRPRVTPDDLPSYNMDAWSGLQRLEIFTEDCCRSCPAGCRCRGFRKEFEKSVQKLSFGQLLEEFHRQMSNDRVQPSKKQVLKAAWGHRWTQVCRDLVDMCTRTFGATFSNEDVEMIVAIAMQLGRLLPWRTIQYASAQNVVLDENEVGSLLIRQSDVDDLAALRRAESRVIEHIGADLRDLRSDLAFQEKRRLTTIGRWNILEPRSPIRLMRFRTKHYVSLLRKAITRHERIWAKALTASGKADQMIFAGMPLVRRILDPDLYDIRDVAGVRITCDYISDVEQIIDAICACHQHWGVNIRDKQDKLRRPDASGYRAIHLDLLARTDFRMSSADRKRLTTLLAGVQDLVREDQLWLPCELQIRTAYEDSWANKSHDMVYRLSPLVVSLPKSLTDSLQILANNLYESDRLSDIVREQIEEFLSPDSAEQLRMLSCLAERMSYIPAGEDLRSLPLGPTQWPARYLMFAMDCAQGLYRHNVRYTGESHYAHAVRIAYQLVTRLGLFPHPDDKDYPESQAERIQNLPRRVTLFALAMLHDCWLAATNSHGVITDEERSLYWDKEDSVQALHELIRRVCPKVVKLYESCIHCDLLLSPDSRHWVGAFLDEYRDFWRCELGDQHRREVGTRQFWNKMGWTIGFGSNDAYDVCRLKAAMLIDRLQELANTPNVKRRRERFHSAYGELRYIRDHLVGVPHGATVVEECWRAVREVAAQLGVEIPVKWYE